MAGVAEFERARIAERRDEGIAKAKAEGRYKGGTKRFDDAEIRRLRAEGMRITDIARKIGAKDTKTVYRALNGS